MWKEEAGENNSYPLLSSSELGAFHALCHLILIMVPEVGVIILGGKLSLGRLSYEDLVK